MIKDKEWIDWADMLSKKVDAMVKALPVKEDKMAKRITEKSVASVRFWIIGALTDDPEIAIDYYDKYGNFCCDDTTTIAMKSLVRDIAEVDTSELVPEAIISHVLHSTRQDVNE